MERVLCMLLTREFKQNLSRLFHLVQFVKCWQIFQELNSKLSLYRSSGKKVDVLCSRPPKNVK